MMVDHYAPYSNDHQLGYSVVFLVCIPWCYYCISTNAPPLLNKPQLKQKTHTTFTGVKDQSRLISPQFVGLSGLTHLKQIIVMCHTCIHAYIYIPMFIHRAHITNKGSKNSACGFSKLGFPQTIVYNIGFYMLNPFLVLASDIGLDILNYIVVFVTSFVRTPKAE